MVAAVGRGMKLPARFVLLIEGDTFRVNERSNVVPDALPYLLARLLSGDRVDASAFEPFGIRVTVEVDRGQGDDGGTG